MEQPHTEQLIVKEELGLLILSSHTLGSIKLEDAAENTHCVYRVSSAKLPEVRQLTKGIDSAHIGPLPQVMPVWTVDGV